MGGKLSKLTQENKQKPQQRETVLLEPKIKITKDPNTGKLCGVPQEWINTLPIDTNTSKTIKTKHFSKQVQVKYNLPDSIIQFINQQPIHISKPLKSQHNLHLETDLNSPMGIKGLTSDMLKFLRANDISDQEIKQNPQTFIKVYEGLEKNEQILNNALLTNADFNHKVAKIQFKSQNPNESYHFAKQLRKRAMCTVYQTFNRSNNNECWAVRVMKVPEQQILNKIKIQATIMSICKNPNIVNYEFSYYYMNCLFMFIEFMDGGCLTQFIYQYFKNIPENIVAYILREILLGLDVLHEHKQIHKDLKSENILIDKNGRIKIANFGFNIQQIKQQKNYKSVIETPTWMAPELIKKQNYNELIDVWSIGIIAVQLAQGQPPYLRLPTFKAMYFIAIKDAYRLNKIKFSQNYCNFVENCLQKDLKKRWSIKQLLKHPFITQIGDGNKQKDQFSQMVRNKKDTILSELLAQS